MSFGRLLGVWIGIAGVAATVGSMAIAQGEVLNKHPRVAELEDELTRAASDYIKGRLPDAPFLLSVSVDPLRRKETENAAGTPEEKLPYIDLDREEIRDEWDDPQFSLHQLMLRVNKIVVRLSLPDSMSDDEVNEVKESLSGTLHLLSARDEILVIRKAWRKPATNWIYPSLAAALALFALLGFAWISRTSSLRIARAFATAKDSLAAPGAGFASPPSIPDPVLSAKGPTGPAGDLHLSDPLKTRELVLSLVQALGVQRDFPNFDQMVLLDEYARKNAPGLGAILGEFPFSLRKHLFSLSSDPAWMTAMTSPGTLQLEAIDVLRALLGAAPSGRGEAFDRMLVLVWRLDEARAGFLRQLGPGPALAILCAFPKSGSIGDAREAFPGAWAPLVNPDFMPETLTTEQVQKISVNASTLKPLRVIESVQRFRQQLELAEYLRTADPVEEREIYAVSPPNSSFVRERPPFYLVFEQPEEIVKELVVRFTPESWAKALFNLPKAQRSKVDQFMGEKEKILLIEHLKRLDRQQADPRGLGAMRETVGRELGKLLAAKAMAPTAITAPDIRVAA